MRLVPLFLTTGLATILAGSLLLQPVAHAAGLDPRDVTKLLAKSQTINAHCKILSPSESQDLRDLVARAEIALAGKYSVAVAKQQLAKGREEGLGTSCDASASTQVRNILKAALQATSDVPVSSENQPPMAAPEPPKQIEQSAAATVSKPKADAVPTAKAMAKPVVAEATRAPAPPKKKAAQRPARKRIAQPKLTKGNALSSYAGLAEDYYVELRCHTKSLSSAQRMYQKVLAQHRAAMASGGAAAVRRLLIGAQARAGDRSCS